MLGKISRLGLLALMVLLFSGPELFAQFSTDREISALDNGQVITFVADVNATATLNSKPFTLNKFDNDPFTTYPISAGYLLTSTAGKPRISCIVQGSMNGTNFYNLDTLATNDSTETFTKLTADLHNMKYPYYRVQIKGETNNPADTNVKLYMYFYRRDP